MAERSPAPARQQNGPIEMEAESSNGLQIVGQVEELVTRYPSASQPEIMRAAEKDDYYSLQLCDATYSAFRSTFGTRLAVAYQHELKLAGRVLYYMLTTGAGMQTLGEEYCDILQVGSSGLSPSPARRTTLVFYQTVLPYLAERLSARAAARGHLLAAEREEEDNLGLSEERAISEESGSARQDSRADGASTSRGPSLTARFHELRVAALRHWPVLLPYVSDAIVLVLRTHLMVYYFEGLYYHIGNRAAGVQYIHTGRPSQHRPRYQILGLFLLIQIGFASGSWLSRVASSMRSTVAQSFSPTGNRGVVILDEDGVQVQEKSGMKSSNSWIDPEIPGSGKCPLCLGPRQDPTATPCGHVFCWTCAAEWCNEKPECPLCRAPFKHSDLVCLYHT